jgi:mono/diheme cytochrome c family protein
MMKRVARFRIVAALGAMLVNGAALDGQTMTKPAGAKPNGSPAGSAEAGKRLFASAGCVGCHGAQGQGTAAGAQIAPPPLELPAMVRYVRQPSGKMPPFSSSTVSDENLADIYAFLKSVASPTETATTAIGDAANGKKLFAEYGCDECHGHAGQGASTGPRIGPPRISLAAVLRYVRAPTGQMPPYTAKVVSDQGLADIYAYLSSFRPPTPSANIPLLNQ